VRALARFWKFLDSETVRGFQIVQYFCYLIGGLYMVTVGKAPSTVQQALGPVVHNFWVGMVIGAPLVLYFGIYAKDKYLGLWWQFAGDAAMFGALFTYILSILQSDWVGRGIFGLWGFIGLTIWSLLFTLRDARRIEESERRVRRLT